MGLRHRHLTYCSPTPEDLGEPAADASGCARWAAGPRPRRSRWRRSMETLAPTSTCRHTRVRIDTESHTEFIDLTDRLEALVAEAGIRFGLLNLQTLHTTTAIVVNEREPLLLAEIGRASCRERG